MLSGTLPTTFGQLSSLSELYCCFSILIIYLSCLTLLQLQTEFLAMESNELTGEVPSEIGLILELEYFKVNSNNLDGEMPNEVCKLAKDFELDDIQVDCLEVKCDCCHSC